MRIKTIVSLWITATLLSCYSYVYAQVGTPITPPARSSSGPLELASPREHVYTEEGIIKTINQILEDESVNTKVNYLCLYLYAYANDGAPVKTTKAVQAILETPEFDEFNQEHPENAFDITVAKIAVLSNWSDLPEARDFIIESLNHQSSRVAVEAASALLVWGEWELAAPVICKNEAYIKFQTFKDDRAIPFLKEATQSGSWQGGSCRAAKGAPRAACRGKVHLDPDGRALPDPD